MLSNLASQRLISLASGLRTQNHFPLEIYLQLTAFERSGDSRVRNKS